MSSHWNLKPATAVTPNSIQNCEERTTQRGGQQQPNEKLGEARHGACEQAHEM